MATVRSVVDERVQRSMTSMRIFAYDAELPRARRATDVLLGSASLIGLALLSVVESPQPRVARAVGDLIAALPPVLDAAWRVSADAVMIAAVGTVLATVVARRWSVARDVVLAAVVAAVVGLVTTWLLDGAWPEVWPWRDPLEPVHAPLALALPAAVLVTASPHLVLPVRRLGRWLLAVAALATVALDASTPLGAVTAVLVGVLAASAVHLILGSSAGRPSMAEVRTALAELGLVAGDLVEHDHPDAGVLMLTEVSSAADARPLTVKFYGRDAHGSAVLGAAWRTAWLREPGSSIGFGRVRQVEHEALLTLLAAQAGLVTDEVVTAGLTRSDDALLVVRRVGRPGTEAPAVAAAGLWEVVDRLHGAGLAHGQIDLTRVLVDDTGQVGLADFRVATVAPTPTRLLGDRVQSFVSTLQAVGEDDAVRLARNALGDDGLVQLLPLVQAPVLSPAQRRWFKRSDVDLDELRARVAEIVGADVPEPQRLYRFSVGSLVRFALPALALFGLAVAASGVDLGALRSEVAGAAWWFVALGAVVAQLPRVAQAVSTMGASPVPLPLGHVYALQLAVSYVNVAIPSAAARIAVNIRFFQRHGVPPGGAIAAGALDGFGGLVTQLLTLAALLTLTPLSLDVDLDPSATSSVVRLVLIVAAGAAALVVVALSVARIRVVVVGRTRQLAGDAIGAVRGLGSVSRLTKLLGGNLASDVLFALALGTFARAFGASIGLAELLLIVIAVSLLAGLVPVPGGIGVTEAGLIYGLVAAGMPEEAAFATAMFHRLATFYVPPVWGFFAFRWLERNRYL
ncbi:MAG: lysylphosphatidylglycerol synthase transmembrane domain-containing protein [Acidimicrobiales bacterium]